MTATRPPVRLTPLEGRALPSVALPTTYALGSDTRSFGSGVYDDPMGIRSRTGDPSLSAPVALGFSQAGAQEFVRGFGSTYSGGVRVADADFNGDGKGDLVAGTAPGVTNRLRVVVNENMVLDVSPFEASFTGGVNVAVGDVTGDGVPDLLVSPDEGGGPRVDVYSGATFAKVASFFGIDDANFRGGARPAAGDVNNDGRADLVVAAGFGGGPRVAVFDGKTVTTRTPARLVNDFFVFEPTLRNGAYVTAGDLNGDGFDEVIAGGGPGGGPRVLAVSGKALLTSGGGTLTPVANFFAGNADARGGVRVVAKNLDGDGVADLVVGDAPSGDRNNPNRTTRLFAGKAVVGAAATVPMTTLTQYSNFGFEAFLDGVYVG